VVESTAAKTAGLRYAIGVAAEEAASLGTVLQKVKDTSAGSRLYRRKNRRLILRRRHQLLDVHQAVIAVIIGIPCDLGFLEMCNFGVRDNLEISENFVVVVVVWLPMLITWMFRVT